MLEKVMTCQTWQEYNEVGRHHYARAKQYLLDNPNQREVWGDAMRNAVQHVASLLVQARKNTLLQLATGFGKTLAAARAMQRVGGKWLWVYWMDLHLENTIDEFKRWGIEVDVTFVSYKSFHKYEGQEFTGIVFDEAHHMTLRTLESLANIWHNKRVMLTAKLGFKKSLLISQSGMKYTSFRMSLSEAMRLGCLPDIEIQLVKVPISEDEVTIAFIRHKKWQWRRVTTEQWARQAEHYRNFNTKIRGTILDVMTLVEEEIEHWKETIEVYKEEGVDYSWIPGLLQKWGGVRVQLYASAKEHYVSEFLEACRFEEERFVCFAQNIPQLLRLAPELEYTVHSKRTPKQNRITWAAFLAGDIPEMYAVDMINEGMNSGKYVDRYIILNAGYNELPIIQRTGRSTRSVKPRVTIFYLPKTKDERRLRQALEDEGLKPWITEVEELNYENLFA